MRSPDHTRACTFLFLRNRGEREIRFLKCRLSTAGRLLEGGCGVLVSQLEQRRRAHPTDLAGLRGARLVTAVETEEGARWAESKIKSLTGGDKIAARFMRCDFFEFIPEFKLLVAGNHKPGLRSVDEAIRRRLHLIPFTVTIPENERDLRLGEKLHQEWGGILQWAGEVCLAWQQEGLNPPAVVREATEQYLAAQDSIGRWIEECCVVDPRCWTTSKTLFEDWMSWAVENGEQEVSQKNFAQQLESHGFTNRRRSSARGFAGVGLKTDIVTDVPHPPVIPIHTRARGRPI